MKTKLLISSFIGLLAVFAVIFQACKKEEKDNGTPLIYTNGEGTIGPSGGKISIEDQNSEIYGATVIIPAGALSNEVLIKIANGGPVSTGHGDSTISVEFLPRGQKFNKLIEIIIPWTNYGGDVYYFNEEESTIQELIRSSVLDGSERSAAFTNHFSKFFTYPGELLHVIKTTKTGQYIGGYFTINKNTGHIPEIVNTGRTVNDIIRDENGMDNCLARFVYRLHERMDKNLTCVAEMVLYIKYDKNNSYTLWVEKANTKYPDENEIHSIMQTNNINLTNTVERWMSGWHFNAIFDEDTWIDPDFSIDKEANYLMSCTWGLVKDYNGWLKPWVWTWQYAYVSNEMKFEQMEEYTDDLNHNNISDNVENTNENTPPSTPIIYYPFQNGSKTPTNIMAFYFSDDPDGDQLFYTIYLDKTNPPNNPTKTADIGAVFLNDLEDNTHYYMVVDVYDGEYNLSSEVKEFITNDEGVGGVEPTGTFIDSRDGQSYPYINIGNQSWMASNLNYNTAGSWTYDDGNEVSQEIGRLYSWSAAQSSCPDGWDLPSDHEWKILEAELGIPESELDSEGGRGEEVGLKLKSVSGWVNSPDGTNEVGFNAYPSGFRNIDSEYKSLGFHTKFWTATEHDNNEFGWMRELIFGYNGVTRWAMRKSNGYSLRCVKTLDYIPIASITVQTNTGNTDTPFSFDASSSSDYEDPIEALEVRWDFEGDGTFDTYWDFEKEITHYYNLEGVYSPIVEVKDTDGNTDIASTTVIVNNGGYTGLYTDTRDGQQYETITIAGQTWFAENLNYETEESWWYNNDPDNSEVNGRLYTWQSAYSACPPGWHLPSDDEWTNLELALGMGIDEIEDIGWRGTDQGIQLKSVTGWDWGGNGTNTSGMNIFPSGSGAPNGIYVYLGAQSYHWTSSELDSEAWVRYLDAQMQQVFRETYEKNQRYSVRCLKN